MPGALQLIVPIPRDMEFPFILDFFFTCNACFNF